MAFLLLASAASQAQEGCIPNPLPQAGPGADLCYGPAAWREPSLPDRRWLQQRIDYYPAQPGILSAPLIIYAHANGATKSIAPGSREYLMLVTPALNAGFAFVSVEFRHPVVNSGEADSPTNPGVPHHDIARAVQFIRANAPALDIDSRNIFLLARSRGTLSLWTALQNDLADPNASDPVLRESSRVNAVYAYNAQTTYDGQEFAELFIVPGDREAYKTNFRLRYPKYEQFGSAVRSVTADDPPVKLFYASTFVGRLVTAQELETMDSVHYPGFGVELCAAYQRAGIPEKCEVSHDPPYPDASQVFGDRYVEFFRQYLRP
ncbi:MAG: hypothetical protein NT046_12995 [Arenimonas sp.]|nr:hypothetical protein [Arenimonas sp.]